MGAVNAMAEKWPLNIDYMNVRMETGDVLDGCIVGIRDMHGIFPPGSIRIANAVGRVENIGQINFTTSGKPAFDLRDG